MSPQCIFRYLSSLVSPPPCLQFFKYAEKERKLHLLLRGVCICMIFSLCVLKIYRAMTSIHSAERFNLPEGRQCLYLICPYLIVFFNSKHIYGNELAWLCTSLWPFSLQAMQCWCEMSQKHKFLLQRFLVEGMEASSPTPVSPMEQPHLHCPYLDHRPDYGSHISTGNQAGNKIWNHGSNTNN